MGSYTRLFGSEAICLQHFLSEALRFLPSMGSFLLGKTGKGSKRDTEFPRISRTLVTGSSARNSAVQCFELQGIELTYSADKCCVSPCVMFPHQTPVTLKLVIDNISLVPWACCVRAAESSILFYALVLATRTLLSSSPPIYYSHFTFWRKFRIILIVSWPGRWHDSRPIL